MKGLELKNCFRKAINLYTDKGVDIFWDELEESIRKNKYIIINDCMRNYLCEQVIMRFLDKYKVLIDCYYTEMQSDKGSMYIKLKNVLESDKTYTYKQLMDFYTEEYYLQDCGGYEVFQKSGGKQIDTRLGDVYSLVQPKSDECILDIGCGRGELTYALAQAGAKVTGVDYSEAAIRIAQKTFRGGQNFHIYVRIYLN